MDIIFAESKRIVNKYALMHLFSLMLAHVGVVEVRNSCCYIIRLFINIVFLFPDTCYIIIIKKLVQ